MCEVDVWCMYTPQGLALDLDRAQTQWKSRLAGPNIAGRGLARGNCIEYTARKLDVFPHGSC